MRLQSLPRQPLRPAGALSAAVVGSGPNGLTAAIVLQAAGLSVTVFESRDRLGGGVRSEPGPRPGYVRDVCSSVYPLARASPVFGAMGLHRFGLDWATPPIPFAHPRDDGSAVVPIADPHVDDGLGRDAYKWRSAVEVVSDRWEQMADQYLGPLRFPRPRYRLLKFGLQALQSSNGFGRTVLQTERAQALFAGCAAHAALPPHVAGSAGPGLVLAGLAKLTGWPVARGGAQAITDALTGLAVGLGVCLQTGTAIRREDELDGYDVRVLDTGPRQLWSLAGSRLSPALRRRLAGYRYGPGVCKVDYALSEPIPWRSESARRAGTLHLGGSRREIAQALGQVWNGRPAARPFVLVGQPSTADDTRAPDGGAAAWAYCHVPPGWPEDVRDSLELQIERFAPGFLDTVLDRVTTTARQWSVYNANWVGGDILGGRQEWRTRVRPLGGRLGSYCVVDPDLYLCSAATPPGSGVHGLCGWHAAREALWRNCGLDVSLAWLQEMCRNCACKGNGPTA